MSDQKDAKEMLQKLLEDLGPEALTDALNEAERAIERKRYGVAPELEVFGRVDLDLGGAVLIHQSSAASDPGCWLKVFAEEGDHQSAHIGRSQALDIIKALEAFVDSAERVR